MFVSLARVNMDVSQIYKFDSLLSQYELEGFNKLCDHYVWEFNNATTDDSRYFWGKNFWSDVSGKSKEIEIGFRKKIEDTFNVKLETMELFLNGQTYGQCGDMHTDLKPEWDLSQDYMTLVYYVNKEWKPEYGGFTCIEDGSNNLHIVYPKPNSAVLFNSSFKHVGLEPTIHCKGIRTTLAQKFKVLK
jgi:hypothetical protein